MIKGIFFDLGYTLEKPETGDWMLTKRFYDHYPEEVCRQYTKEEWYKAQMVASIPLAQNHMISSLETEYEQFTQFYLDLIHQLPALSITQAIAQDIAYDRTYAYEKYVLFDTTKQTLQELQQQGYRIGIISDTWPSSEIQLQEAGIAQYFDCMTFSFQYGVLKPDAKLYEDALHKMGLPAEETLFLDDLPKNLYKAEQYGILPIQSLANPNVQKDPHFQGIQEPLELLELL